MTAIGISNPGIRLFLLICMVGLCAPLSEQALADTYKWVDNEGKTNYSQTPPPGGREFETIKSAPSQVVIPDAPVSKLQERLEQERKDHKKDATESPLEKENVEIKRLNCGAATRNLKALEEQDQRNFMAPDGKYLRPTEKQRQQLIDKTKQQIKENC